MGSGGESRGAFCRGAPSVAERAAAFEQHLRRVQTQSQSQTDGESRGGSQLHTRKEGVHRASGPGAFGSSPDGVERETKAVPVTTHTTQATAATPDTRSVPTAVVATTVPTGPGDCIPTRATSISRSLERWNTIFERKIPKPFPPPVYSGESRSHSGVPAGSARVSSTSNAQAATPFEGAVLSKEDIFSQKKGQQSRPPQSTPQSTSVRAGNEPSTSKRPSDQATGRSRRTKSSRAMAQNGDDAGSVAMPRLEDLLRHPEDLDKIPALKAEYSRKKAAVDSQLREGLSNQLETVQRSISLLTEGQRHVSKTRDELQGIDKLCAESQTSVDDFSQIDKLARVQRNFEATLMMKKGLENFGADLAEVEELLKEDDDDLEDQPNLLKAHMQISKLRDFRDEAMDQIRRAGDSSSEATLMDYFQGLDSVIDWFDDHLGTACMNLIPLVQSDNRSMVVRLAVVVMNEEKNDEKVRALQEAQKDHKDLASRFKSMNIGPKTVRGYKEKFIQAIEFYAQNQFDSTKEDFLGEPDHLDKSFKWFFNDLFVVQQGMQSLMPKKWKIYQTYTNIYHRMMHDFLVGLIDDPELPPDNLLAIIHWTEKYYKKMSKLGWKQTDLVPNVLDNREPELIRQWRNIIIDAVNEWMDRIFSTDKKAMIERSPDALEPNAEGYFRTKTLPDMWRMLHEQIGASSASDRTDVVEGIIDAMFRVLKGHQSNWQSLIDEESGKYKAAGGDMSEGLQALQDWLIAIANDQIACIDDNDETGQIGYLTRFKRDFEPLVSPKYLASTATAELDALRDGYVDLSTHCLSQFVELMFTVDFSTVLPDFFTPKWYGEFAVKRITSTFEDYMADYSPVLHPSLTDILVEELSDELLVRYLSAIRNRGVKFRRHDPYTDKFKDDILTVFDFFQKYPDSFATIKQKWRLVDYLVRLLETDKTGVVAVYETFKTEYWDLQLSWVEAVLRSRDDFERSMLSAVKAKAAELSVERGIETLMSRVR
ncbi:exocyst complex component Sec6, putative [Paecilomyces variotii No. 5]|uniref:Exocyst complex component Sec6, putative n=1 Tax=Byssochlamys spectabilis (strain No. 5 / NBRC 109023) TaxID=1356009 RepID=V5I571_BYSSN|nr:exocyst complex component Sec6, putative [Paecilomyces variotii No. 5]